MTTLTSLENPKIKAALKLIDRREREKTQLFLIEGYRETRRALEAKYPIDQLFVAESLFLGTNEGELIDLARKGGASVYDVSEKIFRKLSYRDRPDGILAVAPQRHLGLEMVPSRKPLLLLVAESIEKPGNLGTILRSCDAAGVDNLILCDRTTDLHNPNVVRASVGTIFTVPVLEASSEETITMLKAKKIPILAATPQANLVYTDVDLRNDVAVVVGTEQLGLSDLWMDQADLRVKIPMRGKADSLNVATATTLLLFEVLRQRSG